MKIAIIGAGITGLTAAHDLVKRGHEVVVFERGPVPGGLGAYIPVNGNFLERYYHHFFQSDKLIIEYAKNLGLAHKLKFYNAKSSIFISNTLYPFSSLSDLLHYSQISFVNRIRCALTTAFFKGAPVAIKGLDTIPAASWVKKYAGMSVYENIWGPLLEGKFSQYARKVPALWLWGRVYDRSFKLGYFNGSVKVLFDALIKDIYKLHGEIHLNAEITGIEKKGEKLYVTEGKKKHIFDRVITTTVSPITERLIVNKMSSKYRRMLQSIDHLGAVCLVIEVRKKIQPYYWVNICQKDSPVLVMVEHTNFINSSQYQGKHLIYLANYIHRNDPRFKLSDKEVFENYTSVLQKINKDFKKNWITKHHISRVPRAQTIFQLSALEHIPPMKTEIEGIYTANIDQMYPHDRNLNQGIKLGLEVASLI
jgi:protoporphyrinogen oxidase